MHLHNGGLDTVKQLLKDLLQNAVAKPQIGSVSDKTALSNKALSNHIDQIHHQFAADVIPLQSSTMVIEDILSDLICDILTSKWYVAGQHSILERRQIFGESI